jgi:hypothetical protein
MLYVSRRLRLFAALLLLLSLIPATASAGETDLRLPTTVASAAAAVDWATTYHALKYYQVREVNPVLRPLDHSPSAVVLLGSALDIGMVTGWNRTVGRKRPGLAAAGLWAMAGFRTYLAIHNLRNERLSARR